MHLIDEQDAWHELGHTLVNVTIDHLRETENWEREKNEDDDEGDKDDDDDGNEADNDVDDDDNHMDYSVRLW